MTTLPLGQRLPMGARFEIEREVGRGGVGVVYRAFDRETQQWVALKLIAVQGVDASEEARFLREGKLLQALNHPHIVRLVACGTLEETPYVAMEWLEGEDLAARTRRAPLGLKDALEVAKQISIALDTAHRAGVIHRDIKPSNIFLIKPPGQDQQKSDDASRADEPFAKLVDFGVALEDDVRLTRTGVVVGTPAYMAPEQAKAEGVLDARADIYSLGASLFELVAGRPPHVGPTAIATLARLVTTDAPRLSELVPLVPPALDQLVGSMLCTDPAGRPGSGREVADALEAMTRDASTTQLTLPRSAPSVQATVALQGTRLFTSIVALRISGHDDAPKSPRGGDGRAKIVEQLKARGADAVALGKDAVIAHLGARRAHGGEAIRALELSRFLADKGGKVGVATGRSKVDLTRPVGDVVDRAAGLAHSADPSQVLADTTTSELARGRFEFQLRGDGSSVVGPAMGGKREGSGGAPFLGREAELAQIVASYERCADDSTPVVVTVSGAPGIGKSRLGREVLARIAAHASPPKIVVVRSESFGRGHPLGLAADVLRSLLGISKGTTLEVARGALHSLPAPLDPSKKALSAEARELLACLIANEALPEGLDPRGARDELWLAMTDFVVQMANREPSVIVLEDLQWADTESIGFVEHALGRAAGQPLLVLALVRPEFFRDQTRFMGRDHVKIDLRPISRRSVRAIAKAMLGENADETVLDRIAAHAAGSPLFAEELARLTALGRDTNSAPTIEAAIQVSLDALDEASRDAIARLSVFGLSGWDAGLESLGVNTPQKALRQLAGADLLIEQAESRLAGAREWAFKHALVHDVAYAMLGEQQKKMLHAKAGTWLARMGEDAAIIARHFEAGDRPGDGAVYWEKAARRALSTNALTDAVRMAETALAFAEGKPMTFARALLLDEAWARLDPRAADRETAVSAMEDSVFDEASQIRSEISRARYDHARGVGVDVDLRLSQAREKATKLGLIEEEARCTATLAARSAYGGDLEAAEREADHLLEMAESRGIHTAAVDAWQSLAVVHQTRGELLKALEARRKAARAANQAGLRERESMLSMNLGFALTTMGARDEAREAIESGLTLAHAIGSPGAIRHGRMNLLGWAATFGSDPALDKELSDPRADADAAADSRWVTQDRATLGMLFYRGCECLRSKETAAAERARSLFKLTTEAYRATGNHDILPVALGSWAQAEQRCGSADSARALAEEAAELIEHGAPSLLNESPVFVALHDAYLATGDRPRAIEAIGRGLGPLTRRLEGLKKTSYAGVFLTELGPNATLLARAREYGLTPPEIAAIDP
jgi:serine/threonine protein kinase/tetratricopeptide (TPR) repeat protein